MRSIIGFAVAALALPASMAAAAGASDPRPAGAAADLRQKAAEALVDRLAAGEHAAAVADFDATMKAALPPAKLGEVWAAITAQAGPFKARTGRRAGQEAGYDIVYVVCQFASARLEAKVVFDAAGKIGGLFFVPSREGSSESRAAPLPAYATPAAFTEREVRVGAAEWALPGTLTVPAGAGPFPALVLVHGSGPLDRDESIGPNKPFRDLASGLGSRGIVVLRYDKRTLVHGKRMAALGDRVTLREETIDDAVAAAALLRGEKKVDPAAIFLLGHSLGGLAVPRIGALGPKIAGFILYAAPSRPLEETLLDQVTYILGLDGGISPEEQGRLDELRLQIARLRARVRDEAPTEGELPLGLSWAYWSDLAQGTGPAATRALGRPLLVLQGGRDYQVTAAADYEGWKKALDGRAKVTMKLYPDLNHLFMTGQGKSRPEEYQSPGHVAPEVIDDIARWVRPGSRDDRTAQ